MSGSDGRGGSEERDGSEKRGGSWNRSRHISSGHCPGIGVLFSTQPVSIFLREE